MAFTFLPPVLIVVGLAVALVVVIRRMPQVASLAGEDLKKAKDVLRDRDEHPTRVRRVGRGFVSVAAMAWANVKKAGSFVGEKVFKRMAASQVVTSFFARLFSKLHRAGSGETASETTSEAGSVRSVGMAKSVRSKSVKAKTKTATVEAETPVYVDADAVEEQRKVEAQQALLEEKQEHEEAMEMSRLEKDAAKELLLDNDKAAEKLFIEMVTKDPQSVSAYKGLAEVYEKQENVADMKASLERVLQLDQFDTEAKKKLEKLAEAQPVA